VIMGELISSISYVALMELADKTMITTSVLACSTRRPHITLTISTLAFTASGALMVTLGFTCRLLFKEYLNYIKVTAGLIFIILAISLLYSLKHMESRATEKVCSSKSLLGLFVAIFLAEMGDKTQLTVLALSLKYYNAILVLLGSAIGYFLVNSLGVMLSYNLSKRFNIKYVVLAGSIIMFITGVGILLNFI